MLLHLLEGNFDEFVEFDDIQGLVLVEVRRLEDLLWRELASRDRQVQLMQNVVSMDLLEEYGELFKAETFALICVDGFEQLDDLWIGKYRL